MKEYIEREALMFNIAAKFEKHYGKSREQSIHDFYKFVIKKICAVPAADVVEVRHGRWERVIPTKSAAKWSTKVSCSQCHRQGYERYNYCPNCGCKMDKEE